MTQPTEHAPTDGARTMTIQNNRAALLAVLRDPNSAQCFDDYSDEWGARCASGWALEVTGNLDMLNVQDAADALGIPINYLTDVIPAENDGTMLQARQTLPQIANWLEFNVFTHFDPAQENDLNLAPVRNGASDE